MRDPERIPEILSVLQQIWQKEPDLRLGQILVNATGHLGDFFYYEDDALLKALVRLRDSRVRK